MPALPRPMNLARRHSCLRRRSRCHAVRDRQSLRLRRLLEAEQDRRRRVRLHIGHHQADHMPRAIQHFRPQHRVLVPHVHNRRAVQDSRARHARGVGHVHLHAFHPLRQRTGDARHGEDGRAARSAPVEDGGNHTQTGEQRPYLFHIPTVANGMDCAYARSDHL
jgi:hypothetical protein